MVKSNFNKKEVNFSMFNSDWAQGTIEYLVIVGIIVVISLIVVALVIGNADSATSTSNTSSNIFSKIGSGGISIIEAISDYENDGTMYLNNIGGEKIWLTRITTDNGNKNYDDVLLMGDTNIDISGLCVCEEGMKSKTCDFILYVTTADGLEKTIPLTARVICNEDFGFEDNQEDPPISDCFNLSEDPIPICTLSDLNQMRTKLDGNYILMNTIDATPTSTWDDGKGWTPIGSSSTISFVGKFNGNNKTITGLKINRPTSSNIGLFGYVKNSSSSISNLNLVDVNIIGYYLIGALAGTLYQGSISNSSVSGELSGLYTSTYLGGLVGNNDGGNISNSFNQAQLLGKQMVGGISGGIGTNGVILKTYNSGNIVGLQKVGGIIGNFVSGNISESYNLGEISGGERIGGIVGGGNAILVSNSYNLGNIFGNTYIGGIVGYISETYNISNVYNAGFIQGNYSLQEIGGIIGYVDYDGSTKTISNSYSLGPVLTDGGWGSISGVIGQKTTSIGVSQIYWDTALTTRNNCYDIYSTDSNVGCTPTNNQAASYYGSNGIPFDPLKLNWSTSIWAPRDNNNPILAWQTE